jgi:transcriptional regulator with XRE-family HTH domain
VGAILRGYRHASGLTQQHLADLLGFDRTYISMIERGRRRATDRGTLTHIARTLAIPPHWRAGRRCGQRAVATDHPAGSPHRRRARRT